MGPQSTTLPLKVKVAAVNSGRYAPGKRPLRWEERMEGIDEIQDGSGRSFALLSTGQQSTPAPGWELLLTAEKHVGVARVYEWTLFALPPR